MINSDAGFEVSLVMNVLVAGGAGFIGSNLVDLLLEKGHFVCCVDNLYLGKLSNIEHLKKCNRFKFYNTNICNQLEIEKIVRENNIDYVMHLAANSDIQASAQNPSIEYENTYSTTYSILEVMRKNNIKKLFFASTSAVYGNKSEELLTEGTAQLSPVSYYGAAKLGSEALISAYAYMNDMSVLVFRFPNVIGPRLTHGVVYDFIKKLKLNQQSLEILGDGHQTKPYIYVDDLIEAIVQFMNTPKGIELYNIGVDTSTSVNRIADIVCEEMNLENVRYTYTGGSTGWKGDVPRFEYGLEKIHSAGWKAKYTSDEAIRMAVKWAVTQ